MPIVNGRLVCCACGSDLGFDEDEQCADPSCAKCERRNAIDEYEASFGDEEYLEEARRLDDAPWKGEFPC